MTSDGAPPRRRTSYTITARLPGAVPSTHSQVLNLWSRASKIDIILDVARAMGSTRDLDRLLGLIADAAREVVDADRCTIFIHDREAGELWAKVAHGLGTQKISISVGHGIAGHVARTREPLRIADAYKDPRFNREVDKSTGYQTRNILCVPMLDVEGAVSGVIQTLNKRDGKDFSEEDEELLMALGGQAAVSLENALLQQDIENLFAGFVKASVYAIEARDPTTSGHSERVAELTVGTAVQLERESHGPYAGIALGEDVIRELRYAALLHDFGKVGVREHVLVKANKLYPHEFALLSQRFDLARRGAEVEALRQKLGLVSAQGEAAVRSQLVEIDGALKERLDLLDAYLERIVTCNRPTVLEEGDFDRLKVIAETSFEDWRGGRQPLLQPDELISLSIPRGSLTPEEREEIESHVTFTFRFLSRIPWTSDLKSVPSIAYAHHEKLNGSGYPRSLGDEQIPLQARIMTIADIYDALTASDRPYKKAVPREKALDILHSDAKRGALDAELLRIFVEAEVFKLV